MPVVGIRPRRHVPPAGARRRRRRDDRHRRPEAIENIAAGVIAPFSSRGLAFDGRWKPELAAAGDRAVATAEPGRNEDGTARYGTVNGSSAAAAVAAGAAALLAQARPGARRTALKGALVGTAALPAEPA